MFRIAFITDKRPASKIDEFVTLVTQEHIMETTIVPRGYPVPDIPVPVTFVFTPIVPPSQQMNFQPQGASRVITHYLKPMHLIFNPEHHLQRSIVHDIAVESPVKTQQWPKFLIFRNNNVVYHLY